MKPRAVKAARYDGTEAQASTIAAWVQSLRGGPVTYRQEVDGLHIEIFAVDYVVPEGGYLVHDHRRLIVYKQDQFTTDFEPETWELPVSSDRERAT